MIASVMEWGYGRCLTASLETHMPLVLIEAWADGPDASGLWRGCWRLLLDGAAVRGRVGVTAKRFPNRDDAISAATVLGNSDKRNLPSVNASSERGLGR